MKLLILGAQGMLGQALFSQFNAVGGNQVIGYDKDDLDVTDRERVSLVFDSIQPTHVLNAVAINAVDAIETSSELYQVAETINGVIPGDLAKLCRQKGITFIHYSSDYVFSGNNGRGYHECDRIEPVNTYGTTKAHGETLVQEHGDQYYIIRLSKLFGKPATSAGAKKSFVDTMLSLVLEGGKTSLDIVDEEKSSPTYAPDLADFTHRLLIGDYPFGIYHGANHGVCTWYDWAKEIFAYKGISVQVNPVPGSKYPRPAKRPQFSELINTKLPAQRSWQEGLGEYLKICG